MDVTSSSSRQSPGRQACDAHHVTWDAKSLGAWADVFEGANLVINLAGRNVNCRYNAINRRRILNSRVQSTMVVGEAIRRAKDPPAVWLQSSTATIYPHRFDAANDEQTGILGGQEANLPDSWKFSIEVAKAWEKSACKFDLPHTRLVLLRSAMVMSPDRGGVFDVLLRLVRFGLGGTHGDGNHYVSWIHDVDFLNALDWLTNNEQLHGPVNICSPNPLPNREFMRSLRRAWGMPVGLTATRWMLEVGALALRTETELILKSRRVIPTRLQQSGFSFEFDHWPEAAKNLCHRYRSADSV